MLLSELNLKALNVNAKSVLPLSVSVAIEGKEIEFKITAFQSGFGSGKKTVVSGSAEYENTTYEFINKDVIGLRASVAKILGIKNTAKETRIHTKEKSEVEKLRASLAVARRLPKEWVKIDTAAVWKAYQQAKKTDKENAQEALKARAVTPLLTKIKKLSPEERALLLASLQ